MSQCNKFRERFSDYIEGVLSADIRKELERHFSICQECEETINRLRLVRQSLGQLTPITVSSEFDFKLNQKLRNDAVGHSARKNPSEYFLNWRFVTASAAVILIAFSSFMIMDQEPENLILDSFNESGLTPSIPGENGNLQDDRITGQPGNQELTTPANIDSSDQKKKDELKKKIKYVNDK